MAGITTALAGAGKNLWKMDPRATNSTGDGDKYAPFALGTRVDTDASLKGQGQFVRVTAGNIPNVDGTTAIGVTAAGVTAATGTGNAWYNLNGTTSPVPAAGDYLFVFAVPGPTT
jgi:hypothetical protein